MVSISDTEEILFSDICAALSRKVGSLAGERSLDSVFAAWLLPKENLETVLSKLAGESAKRIGAARTYQDVAILGFAADTSVVRRDITDALKEGLNWLSGRSTSVNGMPTGVSMDAIAILGIAVGTNLLSDNELTKQVGAWMSNFIYDSYNLRGIEKWQKCLLAAAQRIINITPDLPLLDDNSIADVQIALAAKKILEIGNLGNEKEKQALSYLKSQSGNLMNDPARAALSLAAYDAIINKPLQSIDNLPLLEKPNMMNNDTHKIKILFLGASPANENRLRLDAEVREIDQKLQLAANRDRFSLEQQWAVRVHDLQGLFLRHTPQIVHFSGHGSSDSELIFENNIGESHPVSAATLSKLFSILKDNIRCVILNACYSKGQAEAIAEHIDCVVGMSDTIRDDSAISFAAAFYQALAYGKSVQDAFQLGCVQIDMENLNEGEIPKLLCRSENADKIYFVK